MKKLTLIFFSFITNITLGQSLLNESKTETFSDFDFVHDSIQKITNKPNSIIIETCYGFSTIFLTKDSSAWKGYFIISLARGGVIPGDIIYTENGVTRTVKTMRTLIVKFNADSLYKILVDNKIYSIKQLTQKQLEDKYNQVLKPKYKNLRYGLPASSHDCNMSINIYDKIPKYASYSNTIIGQKELHSLSTIKIFFNIRKLIETKMENYYR